MTHMAVVVPRPYCFGVFLCLTSLVFQLASILGAASVLSVTPFSPYGRQTVLLPAAKDLG